VDLARLLVGAGASLVAVHGRTREQKGHQQGAADWAPIAAVKAALSVPVLANGGIESSADVAACLKATGCDGVMVGEALLENPALFEGCPTGGGDAASSSEALALEYLDIQALYPADLRSVKQHLFSLCYAGLQVHTDLRTQLHKARTLEQQRLVVEELARRPRKAALPFCNVPGPQYTSWYRRHEYEAARHAMRHAEKGAAEAADGVLSDLSGLSERAQRSVAAHIGHRSVARDRERGHGSGGAPGPKAVPSDGLDVQATREESADDTADGGGGP